MQGTISTGIVSAKRSLKGIDILQTTAPISSGSSGGPLIDMRGQVIGINSFVLANGQNLNFAQLSSHIPALLNGSAKIVDFRRGQSVVDQSSSSDPNLDVVLMTLAKPDFAGSELKRDLICGADVVLIDQTRRSVYFSLPKSAFQEGHEKAQVDAIASKFVVDTERIDFGVIEGMQARFGNYILRRSLEKWVFFSTPLDNLRLRTDSSLRFKYKNAEYHVSSGELKSFQTNASVRGGRLAIDVAAYAKDVGKRLLPSFSAFVTVPGEPSLSHFVRYLTKGISDPEKKFQRLTDFVTNEIQTDSGPNAIAVKKSSEILMTRRGGRTSKTVLLASLIEQTEMEYAFAYSGQDVWIAVPQSGFQNVNSLSFGFSDKQWTLIDSNTPGFIIGQTTPLAPPALDKLILLQFPQQQGRVFDRMTGQPLNAH
jgi:hypothetical protein